MRVKFHYSISAISNIHICYNSFHSSLSLHHFTEDQSHFKKIGHNTVTGFWPKLFTVSFQKKKREKYGHLWKKLFKILKLHFHYPVQRQLFHSPVAATAMVLRLPRCVVDLVLIILILYDKVWRECGCKVGPWHLWHAQSRHSWTHQVDNYSAMHFKVNWQSWNKTNKCTENSR